MENSHTMRNIFFFVLGIILVAGFVLYRPQIFKIFSEFKGVILGAGKEAPTTPEDNLPVSVPMVKNCGSTNAPDLAVPASYEDNETLNCLGDSARTCQLARGVAQDSFFPTVFEVLPTEGGCNFKLSYASESELVDQDGNRMAGQSITCPTSIVRSMKENGNNPPVFGEPSLINADKYAAEIYSYGIMGVFVETGLDRNGVLAKGCSGSYIDTIIKSYQAAEAQD